jgi:SAM-dependent methyltransferase
VILAGAIVCVGMALALASLWALAATGVPVVAAPDDVREAALDALQLSPGTRFVDLGCGFGAVVKAARQRGAVVTGYELNVVVWLLTWLSNAFDRDAHIRLGDSRRARLQAAEAVYAYLMPHAMAALAEPLERQLRTGARVASVSFAIPGWKPERVVEVGLRREPIYLYAIGRQCQTPDPPL